MDVSEAKELTDKINKSHIDKADADIDHVYIEIEEAIKRGDYNLQYVFIGDVDFSLVNEIRNQLLKQGYQVEIVDAKNEGKDTYALDIDWSIDVE